MTRVFILMILLLSSSFVAANTSMINQLFKPYDTLLKSHVIQGEREGIQATLVDYKAWSASSAEHKKIMANIMQFDPVSLKGKEKMVYWVNAYNLLTIDLIISQNEKQSIKNLGNFIISPWRKFDWIIAGKEYSLHKIEHEILRPMADPRIHMAINCASLSCPDLRQEAYIVEQLDSQLDDQVRRFLDNSSKGLFISGKEVRLSKIFTWFEEDFEVSGGVSSFIKQYHGGTVDDYDFLHYNWRLNGSW